MLISFRLSNFYFVIALTTSPSLFGLGYLDDFIAFFFFQAIYFSVRLSFSWETKIKQLNYDKLEIQEYLMEGNRNTDWWWLKAAEVDIGITKSNQVFMDMKTPLHVGQSTSKQLYMLICFYVLYIFLLI